MMRTRLHNKRAKNEKESQVTSKTRRCTENFVPMDMVYEIMRRLPAKSVARFLFLSKLWATTIRSRYFITSFPLRPLLQPHLFLAFRYLDNQNRRQIWKMFTYSLTSATLSLTTTCSIPTPIGRCISNFPCHVNGLISLGSERDQLVCNPCTGNSITLPKVKTRKQIIHNFFGFDPVGQHYKVLCMSEKVIEFWEGPTSEHQVFTLGGVDKSWRMIECDILNRPKTNGLCINGVVYYATWPDTTLIKEWCLVRFNVRYEKFDKVVGKYMGDHDHDQSPPSYGDISLMSYQGKVTLAIEIKQERFELWILEDVEKHAWSKICFFTNHPYMTSSRCHLRITRETADTGETVFVLHHLDDFYLLFCDHKNNSLKTVKIQGLSSPQEFGRPPVIIPFFCYVESVMLL